MNKKKKYAYTAMSSVILILVAIIILNAIAVVLASKVNLKLDFTKDNILSFSDTTKEIIDELDTDIRIISLIPNSNTDREMIQIDEVLKRYDLASDRISYERVNTKANPNILSKYPSGGKALESDYNIIFEAKDGMYSVVDVNDLLFVSYRNDMQLSNALFAEQYFSSAIVKVTKGSDITAYVSEGHGEKFDDKIFSTYILPGSGYVFKGINLANDNIPEDADMIIIASAQFDYSADEIEKIDAYLKKGGNIQIIADPDGAELTNLYGYMNEWGVSFGYGVAAEGDTDKYSAYRTNIIATIPENDITGSMGISNQNNIFCYARPINIKETVGINSTSLANTGDNGYIKQNISYLTDSYESGDIRSSSSLAVIAERQISPEVNSKMFVLGTSLFFGMYMPQEDKFESILENSGNRKFYSGVMAYMTDQPSNFFIMPKNINQDRVVMNQFGIYLYTMITVVFIPLAILVCGLVIWIKRRQS